MASDIIQKLGFDATSAIAEIGRLKSAMASLNNETTGLASKVNSFNSTKANKQLKNLGQSAKQAGKGFHDLTISWTTLLRDVTTRVALGGFNKIIEALKEGTKAAIEFGIRIAEIGTIAGRGANLGAIKKDILAISSLTGRGASDVAEGFYQTLSNQVGNATESLFVFKQAAKLSIATNSSLGDSVNLLTAALNGWQMGAHEARNVSNQLFKIIELGRVRVKDLANILGSVGPMSSKLGVSFGELGGSLANITVQGSRANKTITQLRAIMTGLLKPTDSLIDLMQNKWGVQNAEQAIKKFGSLAAVLKEIQKESGGASDVLAKFFPNVRAITGVFALISDMQKTATTINRVEDAIENLNDDGQKLIDWASGLVLATPAKKAEKAFNDLKLSLMSAGEALIPLATAGANALTILSKGLGLLGAGAVLGGIALVIVKIATLKAALDAAAIAALGAKLAMLGIIGAGVAGGLLIGAGVNWLLAADERLREYIITIKEASEAQADFEAQLGAELGAAEEKRWKKAETAMVQYFSLEQLNYKKTLDNLEEIQAKVTIITKRHLGGLLDAQRKFTNALERQQSTLIKKSQGAQKSALDETRTLEQKQFEWKIENLSKFRQVEEQVARARSGISQVKRLGGQAVTTKQFKEAREINRLAMADAVAAENRAKGIKNVILKQKMVTQARDVQVRLHEQAIKLSLKEASISKGLAKTAGVRAGKQKIVLEQIERLNKVILKSQLKRTAGGKLKSADTITKEKAAADQAFAQLIKLSDDPRLKGIIDTSKLFGLETLGANLIAKLKVIPPLKIALDANYEAFKTKLEKASAVIPIEMRVKLVILGADIDSLTSPSKIASEASKRIDAKNTRNKDITKTRSAARAASLQAQNITPFEDREFTEGFQKTLPDVKEMQGLYAKIAADSQEIPELKFLPSTIDSDIALLTKLEGNLVRFEQLRAKIQKNQGLDKGQMRSSFGNRLQQEVKILTGQVVIARDQAKESRKNQLSAEQFALATSGKRLIGSLLESPVFQAAAKLETVKFTAAETSITGMKVTAQSIKTILESITLPQLTVPSSPSGAVSTTPVLRAKGGFIPKGTDTVPAMLTPGEFVVNARSTKRFYSDLVAMNSGVKPIYRAQGGSVNTQTIGDIHVSVQGGSTSEKTIREIGPALRRELRKNNLLLS